MNVESVFSQNDYLKQECLYISIFVRTGWSDERRCDPWIKYFLAMQRDWAFNLSVAGESVGIKRNGCYPHWTQICKSLQIHVFVQERNQQFDLDHRFGQHVVRRNLHMCCNALNTEQ